MGTNIHSELKSMINTNILFTKISTWDLITFFFLNLAPKTYFNLEFSSRISIPSVFGNNKVS